jgi:hypothetical protein
VGLLFLVIIKFKEQTAFGPTKHTITYIIHIRRLHWRGIQWRKVSYRERKTRNTKHNCNKINFRHWKAISKACVPRVNIAMFFLGVA